MSEAMPQAYYQYMSELQSIDFVLVELTLYLDTHPGDQQALGQFTQFQRRKAAITTQFESAFGPLKAYGNSPAGAKWTWSDAPWPWQV